MVITNGYVNVQLPSETDEAHEENRKYGNTLLYVHITVGNDDKPISMLLVVCNYTALGKMFGFTMNC